MRRTLLSNSEWNALAPLGKGAFGAISGEVVQSALLVFSKGGSSDRMLAIDVTAQQGPGAKAFALKSQDPADVTRSVLRASPDTLLAFEAAGHEPLSRVATSWQGLVTSDVARFILKFWELQTIGSAWERYVTAPSVTRPYSGRESVLRWEDGVGALVRSSGAHNFNPKNVLGSAGVLVGQGSLRVTLFRGEMFNDASSPVIPSSPDLLPAMWAYMSSPDFEVDVRRINHKVIVGCGYLIKVPFDADRWSRVAAERFPDGLPEPWSDDPTQWLFEGRPDVSTEPLQVAVARLVGYRWPEQAESDDLAGFADADGIVCLPSVAGEAPAADRVQQLLATAYGDRWSPSMVAKLLSEAGSKKKNLADWLRDDFFKQHCAVFQNRPFVWHVWDGLRDGFSALVNYHRLDRKTLEKLTYTYLGTDWVERQRAEVRDGVAGAEARLAAALELRRKLELILEGEAPFDICVRWKSLAEQPVGWDPDLNDGVRLNVRPFVEAGVLRSSFNIHWRKDRGKNPDGSERHNDVHLTLADKTNARAGRAQT